MLVLMVLRKAVPGTDSAYFSSSASSTPSDSAATATAAPQTDQQPAVAPGLNNQTAKITDLCTVQAELYALFCLPAMDE